MHPPFKRPAALSSGGSTIPPSIVPTDASEDPAVAAFGTTIEVLSANGPEEFTPIAGVGDITGPNTQVAETETTSHSTGKPHRTFIPTLIDDGDIAFPCYFNPNDPTHSLQSPFGLENLFQNRAVTKFRLVNTDAGRRTREFLGFVRNLGETYPVQGVCTRQTTIRITSVPTDVVAGVTFTPPMATPDSAGGAATVAVAVTDDSIAWTPISDAPWITIQSPVGPTFGAGSIGYTVAAQLPAAPARTGHITAGGQTFAISQAVGV